MNQLLRSGSQVSNTAGSMSLRVGVIMPLADLRGGSEMMLVNLLRANHLGPSIDYRICFLEDGPMVAQIQNMGYKATVVPSGRLRNVGRYCLTIIRLTTWVKREKLHVLLSWMEKAHLYAGPAGVMSRKSTAWWLHSLDPEGRMLKLITRIPAGRIFCDSAAAAGVQALRKPKRPTTVCHCAVDLSRYDVNALPTAVEARSQLGLPLGRPIIMMVARLQRWKGIHVFVEAAARVATADPSPFFVVVGGEHSLELGVRQELERQVIRLGIGDRLMFAGFQNNVPLWMQAADVIVHASVKPEPFGTVIVEAMALGKNVIAARAGGPLEIISDTVDGRLVAPGDVAGLAKAMVESLTDDTANRRMRVHARERATFFSASRLAHELSGHLHHLNRSKK